MSLPSCTMLRINGRHAGSCLPSIHRPFIPFFHPLFFLTRVCPRRVRPSVLVLVFLQFIIPLVNVGLLCSFFPSASPLLCLFSLLPFPHPTIMRSVHPCIASSSSVCFSSSVLHTC